MWLTFALVAITCSGTMFMIRFLIALLREGAPSVCYWVIPSAAEGVEREREDLEAGFEFDVRDPAWSPVGTVHGRWRVVKPWEATARTAHWNQGGKKA
jgi:hypothetical protein